MKAREKKLDLCFTIAPEVPDALLGDATRVRQVLLNLAGNAVKFTSSGGVYVEVSALGVTDAEAVLQCFVQDTGIGLTEEETERLFQPFSQSDGSITRRYGGTGLGLVICKQLVEMMGGHVEVESDAGLGSTFSFTLPLGRDPKALRLEKKGQEQVLPENLAGKRILLVEDNDINQMVAQAILEDVGIEVSIAGNGAEALEILNERDFDLVLMDIQMPIMDGLEASRRIRENPEIRPELPIVAMTAHAMSSDYAKSLDAGMNDHITKPIDPQNLFAVLSRWLKG